jgi:hypothetical protein
VLCLVLAATAAKAAVMRGSRTNRAVEEDYTQVIHPVDQDLVSHSLQDYSPALAIASPQGFIYKPHFILQD